MTSSFRPRRCEGSVGVTELVTSSRAITFRERYMMPESLPNCYTRRPTGWTVDDRYVYKDDGSSGAEFAARPGYMRLLNARTYACSAMQALVDACMARGYTQRHPATRFSWDR